MILYQLINNDGHYSLAVTLPNHILSYLDREMIFLHCDSLVPTHSDNASDVKDALANTVDKVFAVRKFEAQLIGSLYVFTHQYSSYLCLPDE